MKKFQCREAIINEETDKYDSYTCTKQNSMVYFYRSLDAALCRYEINTNRISIISPYDTAQLCIGEPVEWMFSDRTTLISITGNGKDIVLYDVEKKQREMIHINDNTANWANYAFAYYSDGRLSLFSRKGYRLIFVDIYKKTIEKNMVLETGSDTFFWDGCIACDKIWLFEQNANSVFWFDLVTESFGRDSLGIEIKEISSVLAEHNSILIMNGEGAIYRYIIEEGETRQLWVNPYDYSVGKLINTEKYFLELPAAGQDIVRVNKESLTGEIISDYPEDFKYKSCTTEFKYTSRFESGGKIFFLMRMANYILSIDRIGGEIGWIKPILPTKEEENSYYELIRTQGFFNGKMTLEDFILRRWDNREIDTNCVNVNYIWSNLMRFCNVRR